MNLTVNLYICVLLAFITVGVGIAVLLTIIRVMRNFGYNITDTKELKKEDLKEIITDSEDKCFEEQKTGNTEISEDSSIFELMRLGLPEREFENIVERLNSSEN